MNYSKISFIIPVYNVEKYLGQCLGSILAQTHSDWECILVDDGSNDKSGVICDEFAAKDSRFKVIHKRNEGVSSARNAGISKAQTKWITFVDADDIIADDYITQVFPLLKESKYEAITVSAVRINNDGEIFPYTSYSDEEVVVCDFVKKLEHYISCGFFFNLDIIKRNNIRYNTNLTMSEDAVFLMHFFQYIPSVYTMSVKKYFYRINVNSVNGSGITYIKSWNHYRASLQIHSLKKNLLLDPSAIDTAVKYQLRMFFAEIRTLDLSETEYFDVQKKVSDLYHTIHKNEQPEFIGIASYSIKWYKLLYDHLFALRRKYRRFKKIVRVLS